MLMACISWSPVCGSAPSNPLSEISNCVTALIVSMPLNGSVPLKSPPWERSLEPILEKNEAGDCAHRSDAALGKRSFEIVSGDTE
eukprot:3646219-Amphidinium_carterae.1